MFGTTQNLKEPSKVVLYEEGLRFIGGNQRYISLLTKYAPTVGMDLVIITPSSEDQATFLKQSRIEVLDCKKGVLGYFERIYKLTSYLLKSRVEALLCNNSLSLAVVIFPAIISRTPVILHIKVSKRDKLLDLFARFLVSRVLLISARVLDKKSKWVRRFCYPSYHVLPIGIELDRFLQIQEPPPHQGLRVLIISRIERLKGLDLLLEAIEILDQNASDIVISICGGVGSAIGISNQDEAYAQEIKERATRLTHRNVIFLGWQEDVVPFLQNTDIVALPSRSEGVPRSLVEAMAASRPVLATNVGGIPDLVIDGETGILIPVDDAEQLAKKLIWFRDHPVERRQMGQKARAYVASKHDIKTHVELLAQHIRRVSKASVDRWRFHKE